MSPVWLRSSAHLSGTLVLAIALAACASGAKPLPQAASRPSAPSPRPAAADPAATVDRTAAAGSAMPSDAQIREQAIELLMAATRSNVPEERANAVEGLIASPGRLRLVAPQALRDANPGVRGVTGLAVSKAGLCTLKEDIRPLLSDPVPQVRASAILANWRCQNRVDPTPLAEMLRSERPEVRAQAAFVLGEMRESSARALLADAARDLIPRADPGAQRLLDLQIAEARIKLGDEDALTDIRAALFPARNDDLEAAALAAQIAGEVQDRASINALRYLASVRDDENRLMPPEVRLTAAGSLAKMGVPDGAETAKPFLTSPIPGQRAQAVIVLGWSKQPKLIPNIYPLLSDDAPRVRIAAAAALLDLLGSN